MGERTPAVPIRQSVHRDYVICLECGWRGQMLRRHIANGHELTVEQYRTRWNLSRDHPMTAPGYSERRSTLAKQAGLASPISEGIENNGGTGNPDTAKATAATTNAEKLIAHGGIGSLTMTEAVADSLLIWLDRALSRKRGRVSGIG